MELAQYHSHSVLLHALDKNRTYGSLSSILIVSAVLLTREYIRMGQSNTRPSVVKPDINPDYQTYGKEDEVDVAIDKNQDYQPSDYDEFDYESSIYVTSRDDSRKVRYF